VDLSVGQYKDFIAGILRIRDRPAREKSYARTRLEKTPARRFSEWRILVDLA
jgi:hypothetical protein